MTRRSLAPLVLAATAALALTACAHASANSANHRTPGSGGFGAVETDPSPDTSVTATATPDADQTPQTHPSLAPSASKSGNGKGNGAGGGGGYGNGTGDGPSIVTFTATGAVCPVDAKPGAPYSQPGKVTVSWKISSTDGVSLSMDGGLWSTYSGQQGTDTLPFQCPDKSKPNTHTFTLTIKGHTGATKTVSATAKPNP
jgi:hypothetical protein